MITLKYKITRTEIENSVVWNITENHDFFPVCKDRVYKEGMCVATYIEPHASPEEVGVSNYHQESVSRAFHDGVLRIYYYLLSEKRSNDNYWRDEMGIVYYGSK